MTPENLEVLEVIYWLFAAVIILGAWFILNRRMNRDRLYQQGQQEARKYLAEGITNASIEAFLNVRRKGGLYGPFESGIASVLKEKVK